MKSQNPILVATKNLRLVVFESAITAGLICMSIMTPFYLSIGMNHAKIAASQAVFTIVLSILNLPSGWIADRFSRKWANVVGDFGAAIAFLGYSQVDSFAGVVICESALGFFMSLSQGVDSSLLRHFSKQIEPSETFFRRKTAKLCLWQHVCTLGLVLLGGPVGAISFRLAIALSAVPYLCGALAGILIQDNSKNLQPTYANPLKDLWRIIQKSLCNSDLRLRLMAYAVGRELTHVVIWSLTPMLMLAGLPVAVVSSVWAINSLFCILGSHLASRHATRLKDWQIFAIPLGLMTISMGILSWKINPLTVGFYFLMGITQGWTGATLMPMVQKYAMPEEQTSVVSLAKVSTQILYVPTVYLVGRAADVSLSFVPLMTLAIFLPLGLLILIPLRRE